MNKKNSFDARWLALEILFSSSNSGPGSLEIVILWKGCVYARVWNEKSFYTYIPYRSPSLSERLAKYISVSLASFQFQVVLHVAPGYSLLSCIPQLELGYQQSIAIPTIQVWVLTQGESLFLNRSSPHFHKSREQYFIRKLEPPRFQEF